MAPLGAAEKELQILRLFRPSASPRKPQGSLAKYRYRAIQHSSLRKNCDGYNAERFTKEAAKLTGKSEHDARP